MRLKVKTPKAGTCGGVGNEANLRQANDSTPAGGERKRPGPLRRRIIESEADALEAGAEILAASGLTNSGPAVARLGRALELVLRKEAARTRDRLSKGKSLAALFPDFPDQVPA